MSACAILCSVRSYEDATSLVTTGEGKFYSLGLDLVALAGMSPVEMQQFAHDLQKTLLRLLTFPLVTVAAINGAWTLFQVYRFTALSLSAGHVYAAGVFIALAHDYKLMRTDRGWWSLNEVHIKRNFTAGVLEMAKYY